LTCIRFRPRASKTVGVHGSPTAEVPQESLKQHQAPRWHHQSASKAGWDHPCMQHMILD
jgi:hypothetical protein